MLLVDTSHDANPLMPNQGNTGYVDRYMSGFIYGPPHRKLDIKTSWRGFYLVVRNRFEDYGLKLLIWFALGEKS